MGREFELKYQATPEILAAVAANFTGFREISMETTYFDTPSRALSRRHITLRRRMEGGISVCTVKTPLDDGSRGEWELEWADPHTMIEELCKLGAPENLKIWTWGGIMPVCGARFTRLATTISGENWSAELALDQGVLLGGGKEMPLCELEVELKTGEDADVEAFAAALAEQYGLKPQPQSKFRRAMDLAQEN